MHRWEWVRVSTVACALIAGAPAHATDGDGDGVVDALDNCLEAPNPGQQDPNLDGFGVACDADYNDDGIVGSPDYSIFVFQYGKTASDPEFDPNVDHNSDGIIGSPDYATFGSQFGGPPGPSGLSCAGLVVPCDMSVVDLDTDGVPNDQDNCLLAENPAQRDTDADGFGNFCDPDLDGNGRVDDADFAIMTCRLETGDPDADLNGDGIVGTPDLGIHLSLAGGAPGPSGLDETIIDPTIDTTVDTDGDGLRDFEDNCVAKFQMDQSDPDLDGFGVACDPDYDNDGDVDQDDVDYFVSKVGLTPVDPGWDPNVDHNQDGIIGYSDYSVIVEHFESGPGPTGLPCPPDDGANRPPSFAGTERRMRIRVIRDGEYRGRLIATDPNGDPVTYSLIEPPAVGQIASFDGVDGSYLYVADPLSSATADQFEVLASDGVLVRQGTVEIEFWEPDTRTIEPGALNDRTLVVYNPNAEGALEIASYYVARRGIDTGRLCPVEMPNGLYASLDQMLAARKRIVEACICSTIPPADRPAPCAVGNLDALAAESTVTHLVFIRGFPARMYGTPWPTDSMEPSLDAYLAYLLYRDEDAALFSSAPRAADLTPRYEDPLSAGFYLPPIDVQFYRGVVYGRIEAMTTARTKDLIDRTLAAEAAGFQGNVLTETVRLFDLLRHRVGDTGVDGVGVQCGQSVLDGSTWDHAACRAGTTHTLDAGRESGGVPGEGHTTIPVAVGAGLFLGEVSRVNTQRGFDGIETLKNWHRSDVACAETCAESADEAACVAASTDFFRELNTECVGAAPGLVGMQLRSYPVTSYGFFPPGWRNGATGHGGQTPPTIVATGGFTDATFADTAYAHYGAHPSGVDDASTCERVDGQAEACPEVIGVTLDHTAVLSATLPVAGTRDFEVALRRRNQAEPGARMIVQVRFADSTGVWSSWSRQSDGIIDLGSGASAWTTERVSLKADGAQVSDVAQIRLLIWADVALGVRGWLDLDGIEITDVATGASLLPVPIGSFSETQRDTHLGDYASNAIDRLGAVAWWGSASHHMTGGGAFHFQERTARAFLGGRSLGEAIAVAGKSESGMIYGDPLYRPSAAALFFPGDTASKAVASTLDGVEIGGRVVDPASLETYRLLYMNVLHGNSADRLANVRWELLTCPGFDLAACDDQGLWTLRQSGTGAVHETPVDWSATLIDPTVSQRVTIRLRVSNDGEPDRALYDHVHIDYRAPAP